eukprot:CAMPEP_0168608258 /NCGR_PEP_ID=MMETSP0449_2-20121227/527_1 /TAXON_ID=1082188 /ORGANISM="Strombidium rassoulzadegani, Strain ras09" /LENGTH=88 /DNA_ID=CAMNT_0008648223 /DNA_START=845 /DNA_END=1107 /DNA_ORIENTATION=-
MRNVSGGGGEGRLLVVGEGVEGVRACLVGSYGGDGEVVHLVEAHHFPLLDEAVIVEVGGFAPAHADLVRALDAGDGDLLQVGPQPVLR